MKTTHCLVRFFLSSLILVAGATGLRAQNNFTVAPNPVFFAVPIGGPAQQQAVSVSSSPASVAFTTGVLGANAPWLTVTQSAGTTPATVTVTANPAGLVQGTYTGVIQISSAAATALQIQVVLTVANASALSSSLPNLAFSFQQGGAAPPAQTTTISAASAMAFATSSNAPWLLVPSGGTTPSSVAIAVNPTGLAVGTYVGTVTVAPTAGGNVLLIPVVLGVSSSPTLTATPNALTFNFTVGGINPSTQKTISLSNPGSALQFSATATVPAGSPQWLAVSPTSGSTPANLTVSIIAGNLVQGTYTGKITITASGAANQALDIPVTLNVSTQQFLELSATSLNYSFQVGGAAPAVQTVIPNSTGQPLNYGVAIATSNNVPWLSATPSGTTPSPITVTVTPQGLPSGTYTGTLTITAQNALGTASNSPQVINVTLTVTNNASLSASPSPLVFNYQIGQSLPVPQTVTVTSTGSPVGFTVTPTVNKTAANINWLLTGTPAAATTPTTFSVSVSPAGLPADIYTGTITLTPPGTTTPTVIPVTLNVATTPLLSATPSSLSFTAQTGSTTVPVQTISVTSTSDATPYTVSVPPTVGWISVGSPSPATASAAQPSVFFVAVLPTNLTAGVYTTNITIHPTNGSPDVIVPVTATISVGNLSLSATTLNFTQVAGAAAPASQTVNVTNTGTTPLTFNAFASGATWLTVTQSTSATPATLTVSVNAGSLQPGNYTGTINVVSSAAGNSPQVINVNLVVAPPQNLVLQPATLNFTSQFSAPAPPPQTVALSASTGSLPFTVAVNLPAGQTWLSVTPTSGTAGSTVMNLTVSVNPTNLQAGTYTGSFTITSAQASNSPQTVSVTYIVTPIPTPVPLSIVNAGSLVPGGISPGEIITIKGNNIGPPVGVEAAFDSAGLYPTTLSDTRVLFDGIPGALHYVSAGQINVLVPYAVAGRSQVSVVVQYKNTPSSSISLRVTDSAPGIFPYAPSGPTSAAALNWNGTINSPSNPASRQDGQNAVVIYATGEGLTSPPGVDGLRTPVDGTGLKSPLLQVSITFGGKQGQIFYVGSAPGIVNGVFQVNAFLPPDVPTGNAVPVVLTVGTNSSQGLATIAIQ